MYYILHWQYWWWLTVILCWYYVDEYSWYAIWKWYHCVVILLNVDTLIFIDDCYSDSDDCLMVLISIPIHCVYWYLILIDWYLLMIWNVKCLMILRYIVWIDCYLLISIQMHWLWYCIDVLFIIDDDDEVLMILSCVYSVIQ